MIEVSQLGNLPVFSRNTEDIHFYQVTGVRGNTNPRSCPNLVCHC